LPVTLFLNAYRYLGWLGYQGAHLFIVVSGFALVWSYGHRSLDGGIDLRSFFHRRLLRIYPLYWTGHAFFLLFRALTGEPEISASEGAFYLSLLGIRFTHPLFYYVSPAWWFVGLILQLYLAFPLLWWWLRRKGLRHFWTGTAALTLASRVLFLLVIGRNREMWSMGALFVTRLFEFTFGMGLAYQSVEHPEWLDRLWQRRWPLLLACMLYALGLVLSFTVIGSIVSHSLLAVGLFAIAYGVCRHGLSVSGLLSQTARWLGKQSYGIMVLHQPVMWWFVPLVLYRVSYPVFFLLLALFFVVAAAGSAAITAAIDRVTGWIISTGRALQGTLASRHRGWYTRTFRRR
jgi:peptidoglycan/LPS O-acetylase OafA/YrhL